MKNNLSKISYIDLSKVEDIDSRPSLLLHSCCGPCSTAVIERLNQYFSLTVLFYNPNVYPEEEYKLRLDEQKKFLQEKYPHIALLDGGYDFDSFIEPLLPLADEKEGGERCSLCFKLRLHETALVAKKMGIKYFSTTLTVSPHKNAELINTLGNEIENITKVHYLPSNHKKQGGYQRSAVLSREFEMYRQQYCGCPFSIAQDKK